MIKNWFTIILKIIFIIPWAFYWLHKKISSKIITEHLHTKKNINPGDSDNYNNLALFYFASDDYQKAIKYANKAIEISSQYHHHLHYIGSAINLYLGNLCLIHKKFSKAIIHYDKSIFQDHNNHEAKKNYELAKNEDNSIPSFGKYFDHLILDYDYMQLTHLKYKNLVNILASGANNENDIEKKIDFLYQKAYYRNAIKLAKILLEEYKNDFANYTIGASFFHLKEFNQAIKYFRKCFKMKYFQHNLFIDIGITYLHMQKYKLASKYFKRSIEIEKTTYGYLLAGVSYFFEKEFEKSEKYLKRALSLSQDDHNAYHINSSNQYHNRAYIYYKMQELDLALADIAKSLDLYSQNLESVKLKAQIYYEKQNMPMALESIDQYLNLAPDDANMANMKKKIISKMLGE